MHVKSDNKGKKLEMVYEPHAHDELGWPILPYLGGDFKVTFIEHDADTVEYNTAGGMWATITHISSSGSPAGRW